jgi:hypothetical protein
VATSFATISRMKSEGASGGAITFSSAIDEEIRLHHARREAFAWGVG